LKERSWWRQIRSLRGIIIAANIVGDYKWVEEESGPNWCEEKVGGLWIDVEILNFDEDK
jgi:hypothetical protein